MWETSYQWTGGESDQSGLYYFNARYYSPELGRFMSADPAVIMGMDVGLSIEEMCNPYMYAMNNPIRYMDPTGMFTHDESEGIFTADYNNNEDIIAATAVKIAYDEEHGTNSIIWLADGDFISHATDSADDITAFLQDRNVTGGQIVDGMKSALDFIGTSATAVSAFAGSGAIASFADKVSMGAGLVMGTINLTEFINNPNLDTGSDLAISAVGFIPMVGPLASAELGLAKQGVKTGYKAFVKIEMARRSNPIGFFTSIFSLGRTSK